MTLSAPSTPASSTAGSGPARRLTHIRELDGVRGIAALMVFFHHVCFTSIRPTGWPAPVLLLRALSIAGSNGVDLFFVLSGFLITSLLIDSRDRPAYFHDFYWKRTLRILPLYLVCLLGVFLFVRRSSGYVLLCLFFISNFAQAFHVVSNGPFWTLAIEEQFYLLWPTVVRRRSLAQLRRAALAIGVVAILLRLAAAAFGHYNYYLTFLRCDGLAAGAFLGCWFLQRDTGIVARVRENWTIALGLLLGIALIALPTPGQARLLAFSAALDQTGTTFICASVVAFLIGHSGEPGLAFLRSPPLTFFGLISYAMYMVHDYVMRVYDHVRGPLVEGDLFAYAIRFFAILSISVALCLLTRYLIELPAISLRRIVLTKPSRLDSSSASS
jgi:peptidoglycan/LPS O-acetylase OafA/YrhL